MNVVNLNNVLHIKAVVSLEGKTKDSPYRIIALPKNSSLYDLAQATIGAFDFSFDHAFGFYDNLKNPHKSETGYELFADIGEASKFPGVKKTKLSKAFNELNSKMLFLFDYGDEWHFIVELVKITDFDKNINYPFIVESIGEAPSQYGYGEEEYDYVEDEFDEDFDDDFDDEFDEDSDEDYDDGDFNK